MDSEKKEGVGKKEKIWATPLWKKVLEEGGGGGTMGYKNPSLSGCERSILGKELHSPTIGIPRL